MTNLPKYEIVTKMPPLPQNYPISAKIILDSISPSGQRITTFELEFPRFILAEFATHRVMSKNSSSSRAIPVKRLVEQAFEKFVEPVRYGLNQSGMQAKKENLEGEALEEARAIWRNMAEVCAAGCLRLSELGLAKSWANRPIEWFSTIRLIVTTTKVDNFFQLRDHHQAQDEICYLSQAMKTAMNESEPQQLAWGEWHIPFVTKEEREVLTLEQALKVSTSRCARVSYKTFHGVTSTLEEDIELFSKLLNLENPDDPIHASPTEHQAMSLDNGFGLLNRSTVRIKHYELCGNLAGCWAQHRKYIEHDISVSAKRPLS